jgi:hypothetical protein
MPSAGVATSVSKQIETRCAPSLSPELLDSALPDDRLRGGGAALYSEVGSPLRAE